MALKKEYIRNGNGGRLLGSITSGFSQDVKVVRDMHDNLLGSTNGHYKITRRGMSGQILSINSADPGLLIPRK